MVLPLLGIAAMGAGVLGGTAFLRNKQDTKQAQATASMLEQYLANSQLGQARPDVAQGLMAQLQASQAGDDFFDLGANRRAQSLLDNAIQLNSNLITSQAQAEQEAAKLNFDRTTDITNQLDQDYARDIGTFGQVVQPAFRKILAALESPNSADSLASAFNFFNIVEPGGIMRDPENQAYRGIGGKGAQFANWLNEWQGKGLTEATRKQIIDAVWNQYAPEWERAQAIKRKYVSDLQRYKKQGFSPVSPIGRQGVDWGLNQIPPNYFDPAESDLPIPAGMRVVDK